MIIHEEISIAVLAAKDLEPCCYLGCKEKHTAMRVVAKDDHNRYLFDYSNLCDRHVIHALIDAVTESHAQTT